MDVPVPHVRSAAEARRLARDILRGQEQLGITEMGRASTVEEAAVKARLLLGTIEPHKIPPKTRCKGAVPFVESAEGAKGGAVFVGDRVQLMEDKHQLYSIMRTTTTGWNDLISSYCGTIGIISKIVSICEVNVTFPDGESWVFPSSVLYRCEGPRTLGSPSRKKQVKTTMKAAYKVLLVGDTPEARDDCQMCATFLQNEGFTPRKGIRTLSPSEITINNIMSSLDWLCEGVASGDSIFLLMSVAGGDGIKTLDGMICGSDLLRPFEKLPRRSKLTAIVGGHCCGGAGALLDLPFNLQATREGGITSSERPIGSHLTCDVTVLGTWIEPGFATNITEGITLELISTFIRNLSNPITATQFVKDTRHLLLSKYGSCTPLPKLASTQSFGKISLVGEVAKNAFQVMAHTSPVPIRGRPAVADAPHIPYKDYTSAAARSLQRPTIQGKFVALGDAEARAWVIFCAPDEVRDGIAQRAGKHSDPETTTVALYNGHPCFVLTAYNWVGNDDVLPIGDTTTQRHRSKNGIVYQVSVPPGETRYFLEGILQDGDGWRPGWWQEVVDDDFFESQEFALQKLAVDHHSSTRAVVNILTTRGVPVPDSNFSLLSVLDYSLESKDIKHHYDIYFPPQHRSDELSTAEDPVKWAPPSMIFTGVGNNFSVIPGGGPLPNDITPGRTRNYNLLSAMAAVAERPQLLYNIFSEDIYSSIGGCRMTLCIRGWWHDVTIDTSLPIVRRPYSSVVWCPAGAYCSKDGGAIMWPSYLEKAFAKVMGSYLSLEESTDSVGFFLQSLTGGWVSFHNPITLSIDTLEEWLEEDNLVLFHLPFKKGKQQYAHTLIDFDRERQQICLRDTWSSGRWSIEDESIQSPKGARWIPLERLDAFSQTTRLHSPRGGEIRFWLRWNEMNYSEYVLKIRVSLPMTFQFQPHVQQTPTKEPPLLTIFRGNEIIRTAGQPFEMTISPSDGDIYVGMDSPSPAEDGVVLSLLYRNESNSLISTGGTITTHGPVASLLESLHGGDPVSEPPLCEVLAEHRKDMASGTVPVVSHIGHTFEL
eukprot:TRINITY_DN17995_c0_g1_i1.p1 TRINITY_DN17995_c0_g1~~TRINITY_DN17995_c0_g1_i1.p1  ORF type:complete len:1058 (+),score=203.96 TRINITY_DN17995_c0_g1_i1:37-3174(+)